MDRERKDRDSRDQEPSSTSNRENSGTPGQVTRTSKLPGGAGRALQRKPIEPTPGPAAPVQRRSAWEQTLDPWMDAAHRGLAALSEHGLAAVQQSTAAPAAPRAVVQRSTAATAAPPAVAPVASPGASPGPAIDPPQPGLNKPGFIDNSDGANIRTGPAELQGVALTAQPLPPTTRVFVSGTHPQTSQWWYVTAFLPGTIVRGYVQHFRINIDLPEPTAKLYQLRGGETVEQLAVQEFSAAVRPGQDLRYYENVLLAVNREKGRGGIDGSFQEPDIFGGGADNIRLEAGRRIWLVSPAYAHALEGQVPDGSLTNGLYGRAKRVLGHIDDIVQSVTDSPRHFGAVAGEYAEAIKDHLPEIIGITAGFILAESASAFLAATPTGVGQLAAVVIQLGLAAFGAKFLADACVEAMHHGKEWLTLAWTAHGDEAKLAAASQAFLKMLVSIAMAALTIAGVRANVGKGLKVANAIEIRPPMLGSPALATAGAGVAAGGPVLTPGSIASAGPVDIGPSLMSATGAGAGQARADSPESKGQPERRDVRSHEDAGGHTGERHVGKSKSWLRERLANDPNLDFASSFRNEVAANRTQGAFVKRYRAQIETWLASGDHPFKGKIDMGHPIGIVVDRSGRVLETSRALLVLVRDSSAQGWHILTSYPIL
jgi:hypothetical protein